MKYHAALQQFVHFSFVVKHKITLYDENQISYTNDPIAIDLNNDGQSEVTIVGITTTNTSGIVKGL